jgi:hypothetical protein
MAGSLGGSLADSKGVIGYGGEYRWPTTTGEKLCSKAFEELIRFIDNFIRDFQALFNLRKRRPHSYEQSGR